MVIPTFRTWVAGEFVTAAFMNANVRDGGNFFLAVPIAELRQTVAQTLTTGVSAAILFDVEELDTDNGHSTSTNTSRYTSPTPGTLQFSGASSTVSNATGVRVVGWQANGTIMTGSQTKVGAVNGDLTAIPARVKHISVNGTTDYIELWVQQTSGGNLNTSVAASDQSTMSVRWVHN